MVMLRSGFVCYLSKLYALERKFRAENGKMEVPPSPPPTSQTIQPRDQ